MALQMFGFLLIPITDLSVHVQLHFEHAILTPAVAFALGIPSVWDDFSLACCECLSFV
jgi:hypothetical protein